MDAAYLGAEDAEAKGGQVAQEIDADELFGVDDLIDVDTENADTEPVPAQKPKTEDK